MYSGVFSLCTYTQICHIHSSICCAPCTAAVSVSAHTRRHAIYMAVYGSLHYTCFAAISASAHLHRHATRIAAFTVRYVQRQFSFCSCTDIHYIQQSLLYTTMLSGMFSLCKPTQTCHICNSMCTTWSGVSPLHIHTDMRSVRWHL